MARQPRLLMQGYSWKSGVLIDILRFYSEILPVLRYFQILEVFES